MAGSQSKKKFPLFIWKMCTVSLFIVQKKLSSYLSSVNLLKSTKHQLAAQLIYETHYCFKLLLCAEQPIMESIDFDT